MKYFVWIFILLLVSCSSDHGDAWIAKYGDDVVTKAEIQQILPKDISADDSIQFVRQYVENWVKDKILIQESENILSEDELQKIEEKIAAYREDITEATIEDHLMQNFSDSVSEKEMKAYHENFPDTFVLKKNIISYRIMEIPKDSSGIFKKLMRNDEMDELTTRLKHNGYYFDFKKDNWIEKEKLTASDILPKRIKNQNLMDEGQIFSSNSNDKTFVLQVVEIGRKGKNAPYSYIKPTIKSVVLNKRKLNLLSRKKKELYDKALENDEIEIK